MLPLRLLHKLPTHRTVSNKHWRHLCFNEWASCCRWQDLWGTALVGGYSKNCNINIWNVPLKLSTSFYWNEWDCFVWCLESPWIKHTGRNDGRRHRSRSDNKKTKTDWCQFFIYLLIIIITDHWVYFSVCFYDEIMIKQLIFRSVL